MTKSVISLALIGLSDLENDPLLQSVSLQPRFQIAAAYSNCYQELEDFAKKLKLLPMGSCRQLLGSELVEGAIWNGDAAVERLGVGAAAKHILVRKDVLKSLPLDRLLKLEEHAEGRQIEFLPELLHRWTPATLRLRELIATQLGPIKQVIVQLNPHSETTYSLFKALDWLRVLVAFQACVVRMIDDDSIGIVFNRPDQQPVNCEICLTDSLGNRPQKEGEGESDDCLISVRCAAGEFEIISNSSIRWKSDSGWYTESLEAERTAEQVMLDLFGRRIAGGIVPVPDLIEVLRTRRLVAAVEQARSTGALVELDDRSLPVNDGKFCF